MEVFRSRPGLGAVRIALSMLLWAVVAPASAAPVLTDPALEVDLYAAGLSRPFAIAFLGTDDLLVTERDSGRVRRILHRVLDPQPALQLPAGQLALGIAINDQSPRRVFVYVEDTTGALGNSVHRYRWNPGTGLLEGGAEILSMPPADPGNMHNGGALLLVPPGPGGAAPVVGDGRLLIVTVGDRQRSGQLQNYPTGEPPDDSGTVLRVQQDGSPAPDNPFVPYCSTTTAQTCSMDDDCPGAETCVTRVARYYAYGLRNSIAIARDPLTDLLWLADNGEDEFDDIDRIDAGMNSGWSVVAGPAPLLPPPGLFDMPGAGSTYSDPEFSWFEPTGPVGLVFAAGSSLGTAYDSFALVADFNAPSQIYAVPLDSSRTGFDFSDHPALQDGVADSQAELDALVFATGFSGLMVHLNVGPSGHVYAMEHFGGRIYRIAGQGRVPVPVMSPLPLGALLLILAGVLVSSLRGRRSGSRQARARERMASPISSTKLSR